MKVYMYVCICVYIYVYTHVHTPPNLMPMCLLTLTVLAVLRVQLFFFAPQVSITLRQTSEDKSSLTNSCATLSPLSRFVQV